MSSKWWILAAIGCGTFMATLDASVVNIVLPTLVKELQSELSSVKWVILIHLFTITCFLLPFGKLADIYGRKKMILLGFVTFTGGSLLCGFSPSLEWLIFSRIVQGIGAAALMANGPAIIAGTFGIQELGKALGTLSMVVSAGLISGPSIGGVVISFVGWRTIFILNLPFGIAGFFILKKYLEFDHPTVTDRRFDWTGGVIQFAMIALLILLFETPGFVAREFLWIKYYRFPIVFIAAILLLIFYRVEKKAHNPLCDFSLFKNRTFRNGNLAALLNFISFSSVTVLMPFFFEQVMSLETRMAGLLMTAIPLTILVVAPVAGRLSDRLGSRWLTFIGTGVTTIGLFVMAGVFGRGIEGQTDRATLIAALAVMGLGNGLFQSPNNSAIMGSVPREKLGAASALLATVRNLGLVIGAGLATGVFVWRFQTSQDFISALHYTHAMGGIIGVGAMIALLLKRTQAPIV